MIGRCAHDVGRSEHCGSSYHSQDSNVQTGMPDVLQVCMGGRR